MCKITHRHEIYSVKLVDGERFIHLFIFNENCRNLWWKILSLHLLLQLNKISRRYSSLLPIIFVRGIIEINLRVERKGLSAPRRECALECSWLYAIIMQYSCIFSLSVLYIFFFYETILMQKCDYSTRVWKYLVNTQKVHVKSAVHFMNFPHSLTPPYI